MLLRVMPRRMTSKNELSQQLGFRRKRDGLRDLRLQLFARQLLLVGTAAEAAQQQDDRRGGMQNTHAAFSDAPSTLDVGSQRVEWCPTSTRRWQMWSTANLFAY